MTSARTLGLSQEEPRSLARALPGAGVPANGAVMDDVVEGAALGVAACGAADLALEQVVVGWPRAWRARCSASRSWASRWRSLVTIAGTVPLTSGRGLRVRLP
jgi:hypothetical protein